MSDNALNAFNPSAAFTVQINEKKLSVFRDFVSMCMAYEGHKYDNPIYDYHSKLYDLNDLDGKDAHEDLAYLLLTLLSSDKENHRKLAEDYLSLDHALHTISLTNINICPYITPTIDMYKAEGFIQTMIENHKPSTHEKLWHEIRRMPLSDEVDVLCTAGNLEIFLKKKELGALLSISRMPLPEQSRIFSSLSNDEVKNIAKDLGRNVDFYGYINRSKQAQPALTIAV